MRPGMKPRRTWVPFVGIAMLLAIGLPWYREPDAEPAIWWGLPDWLVVAALCFFGIAALNAFAWWNAEWDDDTPEVD